MSKEKENIDLERLGKIVELAKRGVGGEKQNAIRIVKKLCKKHGLDFAEVMNEKERVQEFKISYKNLEELDLLVQIYCRYGMLNEEDGMKYNKAYKIAFFSTTQERYIDMLNAFEVLKKLYTKEKKKIQEAVFYGFLEKHDLYYHPTEAERKKKSSSKKPTKKEIELRSVGSALSRYMEDAEIRRELKSGK